MLEVANELLEWHYPLLRCLNKLFQLLAEGLVFIERGTNRYGCNLLNNPLKGGLRSQLLLCSLSDFSLLLLNLRFKVAADLMLYVRVHYELTYRMACLF